MINNLVDNIYVLNLERDLFKYKILKRKLDKKNIRHQRYVGVDGCDGPNSIEQQEGSFRKMLDEYRDTELYELLVKCGGFTLASEGGANRSTGAMGCLFSNRKIIQDAIDNKYKKILILQDDIYFHKNFKKRLEELEPIIKSNILVHLGATEYFPHMKDVKWASPSWNYKRFKYSTTEKTYGMFAIIVGEEMYDPFMKLSKFNFFAADQCMSFLAYRMFFHSCWVAYPNIIIPDTSYSNTHQGVNFESGTTHRAMSEEWGRKFGWDLNDYDLSEKYYEK